MDARVKPGHDESRTPTEGIKPAERWRTPCAVGALPTGADVFGQLSLFLSIERAAVPAQCRMSLAGVLANSDSNSEISRVKVSRMCWRSAAFEPYVSSAMVLAFEPSLVGGPPWKADARAAKSDID
jgi:hypothetical protein